MSILNQKEQVIDIQLTSYGRKILGMGLFSPKYYYFYDDSIIYDNNYANEIENTNDITTRILDSSVTVDFINVQDHLLTQPLGNSKPINDYCPAWNLQLLKGTILYKENESNFYKKIFDCGNITFDIYINKNNEIQVDNDYILIDLKEMNLMDDMKNFEVEIVAFDQLSGGKNANLERKLYFIPQKNNIIDDIIYDDTELPNTYYDIKIDETHAFYYFDLLVDDEIDQEFLVPQAIKPKEVADLKNKNIYDSNYTGPVDPKC